MSNDKSKNYFFENDVMQFESLINGNLDEVLTEFDELSDQVNLIKNLEDLINGEIVNKSENLAAFHSRYRSYGESAKTPKHLTDANAIAIEFFNLHWGVCKDKGYDKINIITLGIGGSYEGQNFY